MFAVIFRATIGQQDQSYFDAVEKMRSLAFNNYRCQDFIALTEGNQEIAVSYWLTEEDIRLWHEDTEHLLAQKFGRKKWYKSYKVEVTEIRREYGFGE